MRDWGDVIGGGFLLGITMHAIHLFIFILA